MEDNLQRVFSVLLAVIIFFLLPLYIAFEKKDDISYALALKITTSFADNVKSKGYLSKDMYTDFISELSVTDNIYDIKLEHVAKKYYPVIYAYDDSYKNILKEFDYFTKKTEYETNHEIDGYRNLVLGYRLAEERYNENQILRLLDGDTSVVSGTKLSDETLVYPMNVGDQFNVIIKNKNVTTATVLFNTLTLGANSGNNIKVYINYGATIQNEEYRENNLELNDTNTQIETPTDGSSERAS